MTEKSKKILFIHPDLGIGGAERLVVDAGLALKQKGFNVEFITSHHDTNHCFIETKDGTLPVKVIGDWLPRNIFGKFYALCMYFRMVYIALNVILFETEPDLVFCDLVSVCIPILQMKNIKVLFYCHYPDQLLSKKGSVMKSIYRYPLNKLEEMTTCKSDRILVNSEFTKNVVKNTFTYINNLEILYPSVNTHYFETTKPDPIEKLLNPTPAQGDIIFLSINRFERKKNLELAIYALHSLKSKLNNDLFSKVKLIIAGGFDPNNNENAEYFKELKEIEQNLKLKKNMYFLKSPSDSGKLSLLNNCHCIIYTPSNEHFGIVPIEAMVCKKPVIAVSSGGPKETVVNNETGFLCESNEEAFSTAMKKIVDNENNIIQTFSENGHSRFNNKFSFGAFSNQLETIVNGVLLKKVQ